MVIKAPWHYSVPLHPLFIDLRDLAFNTRDGLHLASLSGCWSVVVAGFGGLRDHADTLAFAPRLPPRLTRLAFHLLYRGRRLRVEISPNGACYELLDGDPLELIHDGERITVAADAAVTRPLGARPDRAPPARPSGRTPPRRHREA